MNFRPAMGSYFLTPVDDIPSGKTEVGFGGKIDKLKPEEPYKFRVVGVGGPYPLNGVTVYPEAVVGDIVSTNSTNTKLREERDLTGFTIDNIWYLCVDFRDILGVWETDAERQQKRDNIVNDAISVYNDVFHTNLGKSN